VVGRGLRTVSDGLDHPEGVCWSPAERMLYAGGEAGQLYRFPLDGEWLYAIDSAWPRVIRLPLDGGPPEPVIELERVVPDGLAFDADAGLWIGCWQPNPEVLGA
jgi:sugar lactone lactonase YvrE